MVNPYMVRDLKAIGLWDKVMVNDLKYFDGSVQKIERVPAEIKALYSTAFEVEPRWIVDAASRRQKWIDQAQSLNLYINQASGKKLDVTYRMAWLSGLKTTYYLRALGATHAEKSTLDRGTLNAVSSGTQAHPETTSPETTTAAQQPVQAQTSQAQTNQAPDLSALTPQDAPLACSLDDPDCEACQ